MKYLGAKLQLGYCRRDVPMGRFTVRFDVDGMTDSLVMKFNIRTSVEVE